MLNPFLLWFLPLAALPVILHLLNLHRLREVELPTFRFLMEGYVQERSRIRLIEWLLLVMRTALVLLAVAALARPVVQRFGNLLGGGGRDVVFVLDAGMSTGLVSEGTSALHRGREAIRGAAGRLQAGDFVTLVRAGMEPRVLHRAALGDGKRLRAELDAIEPDPGTADLAAAVAEGLAGPPRGARSLWLVSDCRARAWGRLAESPVARQLAGEVQVVIVDVGALSSPANVALLGDPPRPQRPVVGLPVELVARVEAHGAGGTGGDAAIEVPLTVTLDDEVVSQTTVTVVPGQAASVPLAVVPARAGVIKGRLDLPADAFPFDDSLLFVLNVERRVGVLVITAPGVEGLSDPGLFLSAALRAPLDSLTASLGDEPPQVEGEQRIARSLDVEVARVDAVDERRIQAADVIVLADARLDGNRAQWVRKRVEEGAGLVVFPGPRQGSVGEIPALASPGGRPAALTWKDPVGDPDDERGGRGFGQIDLSSPLFAPFRETPRGGTGPGGASARSTRCASSATCPSPSPTPRRPAPPPRPRPRRCRSSPVSTTARRSSRRGASAAVGWWSPDWPSRPTGRTSPSTRPSCRSCCGRCRRCAPIRRRWRWRASIPTSRPRSASRSGGGARRCRPPTRPGRRRRSRRWPATAASPGRSRTRAASAITSSTCNRRRAWSPTRSGSAWRSTGRWRGRATSACPREGSSGSSVPIRSRSWQGPPTTPRSTPASAPGARSGGG